MRSIPLTALLAVVIAMAISRSLVFRRDDARKVTRRWGSILLCGCAVAAMASWVHFGDFNGLSIDAPRAMQGADGKRIRIHVPLHLHEFFHYYVGAKYFSELGYQGLYDCTALADFESAAEDGVPPRITGWVRDLGGEALRDWSVESAREHCRDVVRPRFSPARWAAFEADLRELRRLGGNGASQGNVNDAGYNPPPSWTLLASAVANLVPMRVGGAPTFLLCTSLDFILLLASFIALRRAFGAAAAATAAVYFGTSVIASYAWTGGSFLRYTWIAALVLGLVALRRGRWALAGALLAASACDRVFPIAFALGAALPLAVRALDSIDARRRLGLFAAGFAGTVLALVAVSSLVFGVDAWRVFVLRVLRHGDIYFVNSIGLTRLFTWRDWVPGQHFLEHDGLERLYQWNLRLRATWSSMRPVAVPVQLAAVAGAAYAGLHRRPYEAALLLGVVAMFCMSMPTNYYYAVLALVPAMLLHAAMTAPSRARRWREFAALTAFGSLWVATLFVPLMRGDDIVRNHTICLMLAAFLVLWILLWLEHPRRLRIPDRLGALRRRTDSGELVSNR